MSHFAILPLSRPPLEAVSCNHSYIPTNALIYYQWRPGEGGGVQTAPPEIPKALQNRAKLSPIVKDVKNC